jgi:regulator of replication initiation timing
MSGTRKSDRPEWWGPRWNPNTREFEHPSSGSSIDPEDYFDADEFARRMGSPGYRGVDPKADPRTYKTGNGQSHSKNKHPSHRDSSLHQSSPTDSAEIVTLIDQLLDKIDIQKKDVVELQSLLREEKRRRESLQNENNALHSEMGKLRQVIRDLTFAQKDKTAKPASGPSPSTIPEMFLAKNAPKEVFDAVYKALTKLYHPDKKGGSEEKQKKINLLKEEVYKERGWS